MRQPYDNSITVNNESTILENFQIRSQHAYASLSHQKNIAYGEHPRQILDFFPLENARGSVVFIHGGYWQWCNHNDFAFIANTCLQHGYQCILIEYPLAPDHNLTEIIASIQGALSFIETMYAKNDLIAVGHSAGAHLLANFLDTRCIKHFHLLSGIYDLNPIRHTHLNHALQLRQSEIVTYSPVLKNITINHAQVSIVYGDQELPELKEQSQNFSQKLTQDHIPHMVHMLSATNHYNILDHFFQEYLFTQ